MDQLWTGRGPVAGTAVCVLGVVVKTGAVCLQRLVTLPQTPQLEPACTRCLWITDFGPGHSDPVTKLHDQPSLFLLLGNQIVNHVLGTGCDHC